MATASGEGKPESRKILNYMEELIKMYPKPLPEDKNGRKDLLKQLKSNVIGKDGQALKRMMKESGAEISHYCNEKVVISGTQEQTCYAIELIRKKIGEFALKSEMVDVEVLIAKNCKGDVMGKRGKNLDRLGRSENVYPYRSHGRVRVRADNEKEAKRGILAVQTEAANGRRRKEAKERMEKMYCFVDDMNLEDDADLKLEEDAEKGTNNASQFTLNVCNDSRKEVTNASATGNIKCSDIVQKTVGETLDIINSDSANDANTWIDMWAHFGQVLIRGVDEADVEEMLSFTDARERLESLGTKKRRSTKWKTKFREGISIKDSFWKSSSWTFEKDVLSVFHTRVDLNIITPIHRSLRFKVWIADPDFKDNIKDASLPNDDFQSVIGEVVFTDARTQAMCRGWLCTETEQPLKVDVILPALPFSFRYGIRKGSFYTAKPGKEENEDKELLSYLGKLGKYTGQDEEPFIFEEQLPDGFYVTYERLSHRTLFRLDRFAVTVSNEKSWKPCRQTGTPRTTCDLRVRNMDWEDAFQNNNWEPRDIAQGVPDFLKQLKILAEILNRELIKEAKENQ